MSLLKIRSITSVPNFSPAKIPDAAVKLADSHEPDNPAYEMESLV
jgi:hypothetical protein